ncbi:uncharacterized protein LOC121105777 isoform X4 [Ursus maritimus]|uniref:Uncharacterized protein LOC121105777 isoform X4 n=1 Tax=Ursus maritimus TaxID=29073 RepID=A0A8M1H493_URSMA|nr:uncharacterized protein LOC121105777 isoform X4 [Ursus maritimus]
MESLESPAVRRPSGSLLCEPGVAQVPAPSHRPELSFSRSASQTHGCQRTPGREKCKVTDGGHGRGVDPCARAWESCGMESPGIPGALQSRQLDSLWPGVTGAARGHRVRGKEAQFPSSNTRPLQETRDPETPLPTASGAASACRQVSRSHTTASW